MTNRKGRVPSESIIYMAQNKLDNKQIYIGKTNQALEERRGQHEQNARNGTSQTQFHIALIDFGLLNWDWKEIARCSQDQVFELEKKFIKEFSAFPVDLLNTVHATRKTKASSYQHSQEIEKNIKSNKYLKADKTELGTAILRASGRIKPVINLKTKKKYESINKAAEKENLSRFIIKSCCDSGKMRKDGTRFAFLDLENKPILNSGHQEKVYVGHKKRKYIGIKDLVTGKSFEDVKSASEHYSVSENTIRAAAIGTHKTLKEKWVLCYIGHGNVDIVTSRHREGMNKVKNVGNNKYIAWHTDDTNRQSPLYFKTLDEICKKLDIEHKSHIPSICNGERSHTQRWRFALLDSDTGDPILYEKHNQPPKKLNRKIISLNDEKVFKSAAEAGRFYKLNSGAISTCARGETKSVPKNKVKMRFAYLDDNDEPILHDMHNESVEMRGKHKIILIKNEKSFNSLAGYCRETKIPRKAAQRYMKDQSVNLFGNEFLYWENK